MLGNFFDFEDLLMLSLVLRLSSLVFETEGDNGFSMNVDAI